MDRRSDEKRANVRDVARLAGVSVATVSRVLNDKDNVTTATRARVEGAMDALRFVPSSAARAINSGRTRLIGALIPTLDHAIFAHFIDALEDGLDRRGQSLVVATTGHDTERELARAKKLLDIGAEGLIVSGVTRAEGFGPLVSRHQVPVIATSFFKKTYEFPTVGYDNATVARMALEHLLSIGHRHIGVLSGPSEHNDRTRARLGALRQHSNATLYVVATEMSFAAAGGAACDLIKAHPEITAILCLSDVLAQGALLRMKAQGVAIPKEISVIGIDDLPSSASFDPGLTTVHLPVHDMGLRAAEAMAAWVETGHAPQSERLATELILRATTAPPARAANA